VRSTAPLASDERGGSNNGAGYFATNLTTRARAARVQADGERQRPVTAAQRPLRPGGGSNEQAN